MAQKKKEKTEKSKERKTNKTEREERAGSGTPREGIKRNLSSSRYGARREKSAREYSLHLRKTRTNTNSTGEDLSARQRCSLSIRASARDISPRRGAARVGIIERKQRKKSGLLVVRAKR